MKQFGGPLYPSQLTLQNSSGIKDTALNWFMSYVSNRSQRVSVHVDGCLSDNFNLLYGVPQGACNGSLLFKLTEEHIPDVHTYVDNTVSFKPDTLASQIKAVQAMELYALTPLEHGW